MRDYFQYEYKVWKNKAGEYHRLDGPAIKWYDGSESWYIEGIRYNSKQEFFEALTDEQKLIVLMSREFFDAE